MFSSDGGGTEVDPIPKVFDSIVDLSTLLDVLDWSTFVPLVAADADLDRVFMPMSMAETVGAMMGWALVVETVTVGVEAVMIWELVETVVVGLLVVGVLVVGTVVIGVLVVGTVVIGLLVFRVLVVGTVVVGLLVVGVLVVGTVVVGVLVAMSLLVALLVVLVLVAMLFKVGLDMVFGLGLIVVLLVVADKFDADLRVPRRSLTRLGALVDTPSNA